MYFNNGFKQYFCSVVSQLRQRGTYPPNWSLVIVGLVEASAPRTENSLLKEHS